MDPQLVAALKALSEPTRLRIVGQLAAGPSSLAALAADLDLPLSVVVKQVGLLRRVGLVGPPGRVAAGPFELRIDTLQTIGRALDERQETPLDPSIPADDAKVLRGYLADGRLTTIPAQPKKRLPILRWLRDQVFTEDRVYPEKEVNQRIALVHPDVASLRRYLVDEGFVTRERGEYRRAGGG